MSGRAPKDFAAFILTNGRPDRVFTYEALRKAGYSGPIFLIVDDLDATREKYVERYGEQVVVFDKKKVAKTFDVGDNFDHYRAVIYARNASFAIAKKLGFRYFVQLDDDYRHFQFRFDQNLEYRPRVVKNCLDEILVALLEFYVSSGAASLAIAQGGDFIGGPSSSLADYVQLKRKCMNSFICSVDRPFKFIGRINEDVNVYTRLASTGSLFFTTNQLTLEQTQTQSNPGGMTELYLESGTYLKSFYTVMYQPSSVKVGLLQDRTSRLHHRVAWKNTVPKILSESLRKK